ncbi:MFS transporter [Tsukamurella ocularis]|uniref:MFS transporter n=1 Tax=Tsukamurella ocularis TaxID=1970234 RepID=UPI002167E400|nr:MFS transporter [Tsukamurella ocularis]MCS3779341.1 MFS family permease [Tsukamurella ocularis]MCS3789933.1 MFS family permease [Tsukamurella ocularis]MCS3852430.1 MFS family permease [Tsukamurella ocularis]
MSVARPSSGDVVKRFHYRRRTYEAIVFVVVCSAFVLTSLDMMVVNVAFPDLLREFKGTSTGTLSWTLNAYTVVYAALIIPAGRLADRFGRKLVFLAGLGVFTLGSALCSAAPGIEALIFARVVQAVGAAFLTPSSMGLLLQVFTRKEHPRVVASWSAAGGLAAALAPVVGGLLVQFDWRLIFLINVPIGIAALAVGVRYLPQRPTRHDRAHQNVLPVVAVIASSGGLIGALVIGNDANDSAVRWCLLGVAGIFGVYLVMDTRNAADPLLSRVLVSNKAFNAVNAAGFFYSVAFGIMMLSIVMYAQDVRGFSPLQTGLAIAPGTLLMPIAARMTPAIISRLGAARTGAGSCLLLGAGMCWWTITVSTHWPYAVAMMPGSVLASIGTICGMITLAGSVASVSPKNLYSSGSAIHTMVKQLGIALGVAGLVACTQQVRGLDTGLRGGWIIGVASAVVASIILLSLDRSERRPTTNGGRA